jgi:small subunit ribosomal protein S4
VAKLEPRHRLCRRVGAPLCGLATCPAVQRPYPPGQFGARWRRAASPYSVRLTEKQKVRGIYGLRERQLRRYFELASQRTGETGLELFRLLESRLDSLVLRLGFARTIRQARQLISQGHVLVDGHRVTIRSARLRPGQTIQVAPRARDFPFVREALAEHPDVPPYLDRDKTRLEGRLLRLPERGELPLPVTVDERLVVEHYAR